MGDLLQEMSDSCWPGAVQESGSLIQVSVEFVNISFDTTKLGKHESV